MQSLDSPPIESTTAIGHPLPHTNDRERRRAAITAPRLAPGRYLAIEDGEEVVVIEIGDGNMHLGRSAAADVMLEHVSVSRRHAVVARRGEDTVILDDRSLNGVRVNDQRVSEAVLAHGDEIRLGEVAMRYLHVP
jgi:pSer/pThr/pTyr-binding forkhead associated (FHA) protein